MALCWCSCLPRSATRRGRASRSSRRGIHALARRLAWSRLVCLPPQAVSEVFIIEVVRVSHGKTITRRLFCGSLHVALPGIDADHLRCQAEPPRRLRYTPYRLDWRITITEPSRPRMRNSAENPMDHAADWAKPAESWSTTASRALPSGATIWSSGGLRAAGR